MKNGSNPESNPVETLSQISIAMTEAGNTKIPLEKTPTSSWEDISPEMVLEIDFAFKICVVCRLSLHRFSSQQVMQKMPLIP
jgi:hypothetical protein